MTILFYVSCAVVGFIIGQMVAKHQATKRQQRYDLHQQRYYRPDTDDLEGIIRQQRYDHKHTSNFDDVAPSRSSVSQKPSQFTSSHNSPSSSYDYSSSSYDSGGSCGGSDGEGCGGGD